MRVLIAGSGGREHTLAWKIGQSPLLTELFIAPGNDGIADIGTLLPIAAEDTPAITDFAKKSAIDLVVIGPEAALAAGLSDALRAEGILVFGPSQAAAQLETSKAFSKAFMERHAIPTAQYKAFTDYLEARDYLQTLDRPVVIKASGLAAGKGVILPETKEQALDALHAMMVERQFSSAGDSVVIEERLVGEEVSLLAFSDGVRVCVMPPAQDHKRLMDGDRGPNTGGMGAYAPAPVLSREQIEAASKNILQPTIDGMREEGFPYRGVLYAGLILTADGPKVLEFNARFGDPETQVIIPLLESDLLPLLLACAQGDLTRVEEPRWKPEAAVCVVLASGGYPGKSDVNHPISGLDRVLQDGMVFHAGTRREGNAFVNAGGRVLGVTCWAADLRKAIDRTYQEVAGITFQGMQKRSDIAQKALK